MPTIETPLPKRQQITANQHIFPKSGLRRFADKNGHLHVLELRTKTMTWRSPKADQFVVIRGWDQRSEKRLMGEIESEFGRVVKYVLQGARTLADPSSHEVISRMQSLWRIRHLHALNPIPDIRLNGIVMPERALSEAAMDSGEDFGIISITPDGYVPSRMIAGPRIHLALDQQVAALSGTRWGIIRASEGEFVLPDSFGDYLIMPVSPTCCLIANQHDGTVGLEGVAHINATAMSTSVTYLAGRDLTACPGLEPPCIYGA